MRAFGATLILTAAMAAPAAQSDPGAAGARPGDPYPMAVLTGATLRVSFYLPDARRGYYRGTRFDWSGVVSQVEHKGHSFFTDFSQQHNPTNHDDICGTAEEFGMTIPPPGYEQARPGDPFLKIGVGVLIKDQDAPYGFWKPYRLQRPGDWTVSQGKETVTFAQALQGPAGWACDYSKTIRIEDKEPRMTISRRLKNTGTNTILTDHYGHNFLRIDDVPAGPAYRVVFPWSPAFSKDSQPAGCVSLRGNALVFGKEVPDRGAVWVLLEGFGQEINAPLRVENLRSGGVLTIRTDQPLKRCAFYSSRGALCPEPFVHLSVEPGRTVEWATTYVFEAN